MRHVTQLRHENIQNMVAHWERWKRDHINVRYMWNTPDT